MKTRLLLAILMLVFGGCIRRVNVIRESAYSRFDGQEWEGRFAGFAKSPTEHIIDESKNPIVARRVRGFIRSEAGLWPETARVLFEIRGPGNATSIRGTLADREGRF